MNLNILLSVLGSIFRHKSTFYYFISIVIVFKKPATCLWSQHGRLKTSLLPTVPQRYAEAGEFPFIVSIELRDTVLFPICAGSIVGPRTVITAAFCFGKASSAKKTGLLKQVVVIAGTHYLSPNESVDFIYREVVKEVAHPRYVNGALAHDISILTVREKFVFDAGILLGRIRMSDKPIQDGTICQVLGWGTEVNFGVDVFNIPLTVTTIRVYNYLMCELIFEMKLSPDQICSERPNLYVKPCSLDIGSPLICNNVLFGIGSNYWNCSNPKEPNMFTSVSNYIRYVAYTQGNAEFSYASRSLSTKVFLVFIGMFSKLFCITQKNFHLSFM